jgi:hypothetical protein
VQRSPSPLDEDDLEDFETWKRIVRVIGLIDARASGNDRRIRTEGAQPFAHAGELPSSPLMRYLANQLTAGAEAPIVSALERLPAMRIHFRQRQLGDGCDFGASHSTSFGGKMGRCKLNPTKPPDT